MPLTNDDIKRVVDAIREDRERDTARVFVRVRGTSAVYALTEDQRLVHALNPAALTAQDPAWDITDYPPDSAVWDAPTTYPGGVPDKMRS